ncbi:DUF2207 domain-containing protein [Furfurilactobacillus siliginis]|nr:DUF2207 domain-containing protein [Furfurilactobacillus siliginis]GEK29558.1 membrane protein [Furfurilactobacillus siliginis]
MKKQTQWWLMIVTTIIFMLGLGIVGRADGYDITKYDVHVNVLKNGDADLTQHVTYNFDGDFHGVTYKQTLGGIAGVDDPTVSVKGKNGREINLPVTSDEQNNTVKVTKTQDALLLKVFHKISEQRATFTYRYRLHGVVTNYADTARLNWKIVGDGWSVPLHNVRVVIQLPETNIDKLQAWTHGPTDGQTTVDKKNGRITLTVAQNPEESFIESDLLFPTSVTAANPRIVNEKKKVAVQKEERSLAEKANAQRKNAVKTTKVMLGTLAAIVVGLLGGTGMYLWRRPANRRKPTVPIDHWYDVPRVAPALAEGLTNGRIPDVHGLTGEMLVAVNQRELKIEPEEKTFRLTQVGKLSNKVLKFLINDVGDGESVTMKAVKHFGKKDKEGRLTKRYDAWQSDVEDQRQTYLDAHNVALRRWWLVLGVVVSALAALAVLLIFYLPVSLRASLLIISGLVVIGVWVTAIWQRRRINQYTDEGAQLLNELNGFKRMLKDVGHFNTAKVGDLVLWEQILPYAAAFGLAKQVTDALATDFGTEALVGTGLIFPLYFGPGFASDFDSGFQGGLSSAISSSASNLSSTSGGSGGFSGGSSGGFGGGSGGGAF